MRSLWLRMSPHQVVRARAHAGSIPGFTKMPQHGTTAPFTAQPASPSIGRRRGRARGTRLFTPYNKKSPHPLREGAVIFSVPGVDGRMHRAEIVFKNLRVGNDFGSGRRAYFSTGWMEKPAFSSLKQAVARGLAPADAAAFSRLSGAACRFAQQAPLPGSYYITCILEHKKFLQKFPPNFLRPFYAHRTKPRYNVAARSLV